MVKKGTSPAAYAGPGFNTPVHGIMAALGRFFNCNRYVAAVHRLLLALVCMGGYQAMQAAGYVSYHGYDPVWIAANPSHIAKYAFMFTTMFSERLKFYFIWKASEGACILGGFGFSGYDANGHSKGYRAAENMDVLGHELATSVQILSRGWNKGTQGWLERYTFHRYNRSLFITYFISGVWHGVYPGFLLMFMSVVRVCVCVCVRPCLLVSHFHMQYTNPLSLSHTRTSTTTTAAHPHRHRAPLPAEGVSPRGA